MGCSSDFVGIVQGCGHDRVPFVFQGRIEAIWKTSRSLEIIIQGMCIADSLCPSVAQILVCTIRSTGRGRGGGGGGGGGGGEVGGGGEGGVHLLCRE